MKYWPLKEVIKMEVKAKHSNEKVDIYLYGDIVGSERAKSSEDEEKTAPLQIKRALDDAKGKDVNLYINSGGGSAFGGQTISSLIKRYEGKTSAFIDGLCASAATMIAMAADDVYMSDNAVFMYHQAWAGFWDYGNAKVLKEKVDEVCRMLEAVNESMLSEYKNYISDEVKFKKVENNFNGGKDTWLAADEAKDIFGFKSYKSESETLFAKSEFLEIPAEFVKNKQALNSDYDSKANTEQSSSKIKEEYFMFDF